EIQFSISLRVCTCDTDGVCQGQDRLGVQAAFSESLERRSPKRGGIEQARQRGVGACGSIQRQPLRSFLFQAAERLNRGTTVHAENSVPHCNGLTARLGGIWL